MNTFYMCDFKWAVIFHTSPWGLGYAYGKQTGAWAVRPRAVNKAKGGMGGGVGRYVVYGWCISGVMWFMGGGLGCYVVSWGWV
jgi:hypothetical protein